jgi:hypothetical protein
MSMLSLFVSSSSPAPNPQQDTEPEGEADREEWLAANPFTPVHRAHQLTMQLTHRKSHLLPRPGDVSFGAEHRRVRRFID